MNKPNMKDAIEALIPYSGEINFVHNKRDTELLVSSSMTVCYKHVEKYYLSIIIYKCHLSFSWTSHYTGGKKLTKNIDQICLTH